MLKLLLAATAVLLFSAGSVIGAQAANEAHVRVIHASPDAPAVDVYANGNRVLSNVPFKTASDYLAVPAGSYTFEVRAAGSAATSQPVLSTTADLKPDTFYTVVALDRLSQIKARLFVDDNSAPAAGKAHVQVLHASPDAPAVDIAVKGGPVLVPSLPFGELKGPLPVDAGTYNLEVRVAGTNNVALPLDGVRLDAGKVYTFVATGLAAGNPALSVLPIAYTPAAASAPSVSAPHAGDAGLLDRSAKSPSSLIWMGGALLVAMAGFGAATLAASRIRR